MKLRVDWLTTLIMVVCGLLGGPGLPVLAQDSKAPVLFRTDIGADDKLPWFMLKPGEFPPVGSAHYVSGELVALDHVNRTGVLRPDRTDAQRRGDWDLPHAFTLLPFGSLSYHGAPAELKDIPLGTHLHGWFYLEEPAPKNASKSTVKTFGPPKRVSLEAAFNRCFRLEDDLSFCWRQNRHWRVESLATETNTLLVTGITAGQADAKPTAFQILGSTRVWHGRSLVTLSDLQPGSNVGLNLTYCTLKGPGRVVSVWLDAESRELAQAHQLEVHRQFQREHGLAGWVDDVDNELGTMCVSLFAGFDPSLKNAFVVNESITAAVAEENLRTWDQINDRKSGTLLEVQTVTAPPAGHSGFRVKLKPSLLLEGFRPKRVVRVWPASWKVDDLPREERLYQ